MTGTTASIVAGLTACFPGAKVSQRAGVTVVAMSGGTCKICGCTDADCSHCIRRTGKPCSWVDNSHDICSACVEGVWQGTCERHGRVFFAQKTKPTKCKRWIRGKRDRRCGAPLADVRKGGA